MTIQSMQFARHVALAGLAFAVAGCSVLEGDKIDYKSAGAAPSLEVPPDLTQPSRETRYGVPGGTAVTASGYQSGRDQAAQSALPTAARSVGDMRIERDGNQRWLVVDRPADRLWEPIRDFWQDNGFLLAIDQRNLGIMETDWAENRAKIPQDFIRRTIGKVFDSAYSSSERDKFRTRLERTGDGKTEIFVSHRGMEEVYASSAKDRTVWQPRPPNPELEAEFLRRLMVKLGASEEASKSLIASPQVAPPSARVANVDGTPAVIVDDSFDRAWRRVGLALDRTGFTVEDRDRTKGLYFVRYVEPNPDRKEPGFFNKIFGSGPAAPPLKYQIAVKGEGNTSTVSVLGTDGAPQRSTNAQRIVKVIADDLR
ncbi:MAG: outer membrane protein assembly factor BamC [Burkholderiaceae bacterium]